jgi:hypothetical protein
MDSKGTWIFLIPRPSWEGPGYCLVQVLVVVLEQVEQAYLAHLVPDLR